jgi:hypothetical protein
MLRYNNNHVVDLIVQSQQNDCILGHYLKPFGDTLMTERNKGPDEVLKKIIHFCCFLLVFSGIILLTSCNNTSETENTKPAFIKSVNTLIINLGTRLEIRGTLFGETKSNSYVNLNGFVVTDYEIWEDNIIICNVTEPIQSGRLYVIKNNQMSNYISYTNK